MLDNHPHIQGLVLGAAMLGAAAAAMPAAVHATHNLFETPSPAAKVATRDPLPKPALAELLAAHVGR